MRRTSSPIIPVLVARPLRGHIARLVLRSAPRTLSKRYVSSPTSVSVLSASVPSATSDIVAFSRGTPSRPAWPCTSFVMSCSLFLVRTPLFSATSCMLLSTPLSVVSFISSSPRFMPQSSFGQPIHVRIASHPKWNHGRIGPRTCQFPTSSSPAWPLTSASSSVAAPFLAFLKAAVSHPSPLESC